MTDPAITPGGTSDLQTDDLAWSRYNRLFETQRYGCFLYNALSNVLFKLDGAHCGAVRALRDAASGGATGRARAAAAEPLAAAFGDLAAAEPDFAGRLREARVLAGADEEQGLLLSLRYDRNAAHYATDGLGLTVCPTLGCNFRCGYCFEHSQAEGLTMSPETVDRLLAFIASFGELSRLSLAWYGGEPTLAWDVIRDITHRVKDAGHTELGAGLVTNGYLLDEQKIAELDELEIASIQITLDGPLEIHDRRRVLAGGRPTFDRILANVDALMASSWSGRCSIRVNIDGTNRDLFLELRAWLLERYEGKRLSVYAGHVHAPSGHLYEGGCSLSGREWADYSLGLYAESGVVPLRGFYPSTAPGGCVANARRGFVVGPAGELYKCWEDVGTPDMEIGSVHADGFITDPALRARYAEGTAPENDPACVACDVLPICDGGCPHQRLLALRSGERSAEHCSPYKHRLEEYLEAYYDAVLTREICAAVLAPGRPQLDERGWRVVPPPATPNPDPLAGPADRED